MVRFLSFAQKSCTVSNFFVQKHRIFRPAGGGIPYRVSDRVMRIRKTTSAHSARDNLDKVQDFAYSTLFRILTFFASIIIFHYNDLCQGSTVAIANKGVDQMMNGPDAATIRAENERLRQHVAELEQQTQQQRTQIYRYEQILNSVPAIVITKDIHSRPTYGNTAFRELYGMSQAELQGMIDAALNDPTYTAQVEDDAHVLQTGQIYKVEEAITGHDGTVHMVQTIKAPLYNEAGQIDALVGVLTDITAWKQQEEELRRSEIRLQALLDAIPDMMLRISQDNIFLDYREARDIDAYVPPEVFLGKYVTDVLPPEVAASIIQTGAEVLHTGKRQMIEYQLAMPDGLHSYDTWVVASADNTYLLLIRDSTERKRQEHELLNVNERLRFILEGSQDGAWDTNLEAGEFYYSQRFAEMMGYHPNELAPSIETWMNNIHPDDVAKVNQALQDYLTGQVPVYEYEHRLRHKSGEWIWILARGKVTLRDEQGKPIRMAGTISDITQRKRQEEELLWFSQGIESASDLIGISDIHGQSRYHNQAFVDRLGYTSAELNAAGGPPALYTDPQQATEVFTALQQGRSWTGEITLRSKAGEIVPILLRADIIRNEADQAIGFIGVQTDITTQKQAETERRRLVALVENSSDFIGVAALDGHGLYLNAAGRQLVGLESDAAFHQTHIINYFPPEEQERVQQEILPTIMKEGLWKGECLFRNFKTGERIPVEWNVFLIRDDTTGEPISVSTVTRDLRELKRQEAERTALQQRIIDAQRDALRELSSPLIPITDEVVIMPLIGTIDSRRAQQVMEALLDGIAQHQANLAIIDITGVSIVDTQVAHALISAAQAVKLLGAQVMLTGIQPQIAQTLVHLGVDLSSILTRGSLQAGIATALGPASNGKDGVHPRQANASG